MSEELRQVRDTLIEALRRSDTLTVEGRALFRRYEAMSAAATGTAPPVAGPAQAGPAAAQPGVPATQAAPAAPARRRPDPVEEDEEFGGSFMVRSNSPQQAPPGITPTQPQSDLPRSLRHRRR